MRLFHRFKRRPSLKNAFGDVWEADPVMVLIVAIERGGQIRVRGVEQPGVPEPFSTDFRTLGSDVDAMAADLHAHWVKMAKEEERRNGNKVLLFPDRT